MLYLILIEKNILVNYVTQKYDKDNAITSAFLNCILQQQFNMIQLLNITLYAREIVQLLVVQICLH